MEARKRLSAVVAGGALLLAAAACGGGGGTGNQPGESTQPSAGGGGDKAFVWALSAEPKALDGAYVSDGESLRVVRQIFEGLVGTKPGATDVVPALATKWESTDATNWTFTLKQGVKFHDGTDFNAEAACWNFERWFNFKGAQQNPAVSYYWQTVFGGFAKNEDPEMTPSSYKGCKTEGADKIVISLASPSASFISALSLPSFSMVSPAAIQKSGDAVEMKGDAPEFTGKFATEAPVGTGPYKFVSWARGDKLTLEAFDGYHGEKAKIKSLIFRAISDAPARRQALESGEIDGFDQVEPADVETLKGAGYTIQERPALNVGYIGFNQKLAPMDNPKIRQAIAHAINREALVKAKYPPGSTVATQFMPPELAGYNEQVTTYPYDVNKAKQLIAESGVANPTVELWYPTGVTRPYMPDPKANFEAFKADLEAAGFKVVVKSARWTPEYIDAVDNGKAMIFMIGWNADFADADNFVGTFFQAPQKRWSFDNKEIFGKLDEAERETDPAKRTALYQEANKLIMDFLPGLPYVHNKSFVGLGKDIKGFLTDPLSNENFSLVSRG
ncbi:ABC transporter substrate-binding protein [Nonomuraea sp. NPDC050310]|uniref:ABC transporter substrate-binding protein n=1 Tax=Nonomuraea sp. NPDC050310 TaxID=3154935 RepID=UPI0033E56C9C